MNEFFAKRGVGYILNAIACVLGIVCLVCYLVSAEDKSKMTETFVSALVYVPLILASAVNAVGLFYSHSMIKVAAFALYFFALATWILTQAGYIVNVFMGIDGNVFSFAYILTVVCVVCCMVLSIVSVKNFKDRAKEA